MPSQSTLLGAAGEHYILSELLRRGYIAALAPQGVPSADIVVTSSDLIVLCSIQVKTRRQIGSDGGWHMKAKHEKIVSDRLFYCFVDFGRENLRDPTKLYVLPSKIVAETLSSNYAKWLSTPGKNGKPHKDTDMRRLLPDYSSTVGNKGTPNTSGWLELYRDAWELLGLRPMEKAEIADQE